MAYFLMRMRWLMRFFFVFLVDEMVGSWIFSSGKLVDLMVGSDGSGNC